MHLAGEESCPSANTREKTEHMTLLQCQIPQSTESKAAVTARKTSPTIVKNVVICLGAGADSDQSMLRGTIFWLAASDQVRSWSSH